MANVALESITVGMVVFSSAISSSASLPNIWLLINQMQLLFLLLLIGAYIPSQIIQTIVGQKFISFPYSYIPKSNMKIFSNTIGWFNKEQNNDVLNEIGIESGSTIVNTYSLFLFILMISVFHLFIYLIVRLLNKCSNS